MTEKQPYSYVTLRYSHDVLSGEFVNVGLIMLSKDGCLSARTRKTIGRIKAIFPDLNREAFVASMKSVDRSISRISKQASTEGLFLSELKIVELARKIVPFDDSALGWSSVSGGLTSDLDRTFQRLFDRLVARYDTASKARIQDEDVWRPVREQLDERGLDLPFESKLIEGKADSIEFSKSWKNGNWHVYEALSMDLANADGIKDKARRWRGHLEAVAAGATEDFDVNFVVGKPSDVALLSAYDNALEILREAPFISKIYNDSEVSLLVDKIQRDFELHEVADFEEEQLLLRH